MQSAPIFLTNNDDPEIDQPHFSLAAFIGDDGNREQVNLLVNHPQPDVRRHASQAMIYGLAIMTLDAQGVIQDEINRLLASGPLSEVDVVNRITLLLQDEQNDRPI